MTLTVLGTGSTGNVYLLQAGGRILILDAGLPLRQIVAAVDDWKSVAGCLITHEHKDHSIAAADLLERGIPVYLSTGTKASIREATRPHRRYVVDAAVEVPNQKLFHLDGFTVMPFGVEHDAREPQGFLVKSDRTGEQLLYATDTAYLRYRFKGVHYWLIECNYCDDIMAEDSTAPAFKGRLASSHMSLETLKQFFQASDLTETRHIVLCHLSDTRSDEDRMVREIAEATQKPTCAARAGLSIELALAPF